MTTHTEVLRRVLREDPLFDLLACARPAAETWFLCGIAVAEALSGARPQEVLLAVVDPHAAATRFAAASRGRAVTGRGDRGTPTVCCRLPETRHTTFLPLSAGPEALLSRSCLAPLGVAVALNRDGPALFDPHGALPAVGRGRLELAPGADPAARPVQTLLAAELCTLLSLEPDEAAVEALRAGAKGLAALAPSRAWGLLGRLLRGGGVSRKAVLLRRLGALEALLPEVAAILEVPQNYFHHLPVWEHTLETVDNLERLLDHPDREFRAYGTALATHLHRPLEGGFDRRTFLLLAALVHDTGKAATMTVIPSGRIRFQGHQREGAALAAVIAGRLGLGYRGRRYLTSVVGQHMAIGHLMKEGESSAARLAAARRMGDNCLDICVLSLADRMATRGEASTAEGMEHYRRVVTRTMADHFWDRGHPTLVSGADLLLHSGAEPGPALGAALFDLRVAQRQSLVSSRQQALEYIGPDFKGRMR